LDIGVAAGGEETLDSGAFVTHVERLLVLKGEHFRDFGWFERLLARIEENIDHRFALVRRGLCGEPGGLRSDEEE
jgi:hypothetical protein